MRDKLTGEIIKCKICNKERYVHRSRLTIGKGKYCSKKCKYKAGCSEETKRKMSKSKKGKHYSFATEFKKGRLLAEKHPNWRGGESIGYQGYCLIYKSKHPIGKYIKRCRLIMEKYLNRFLTSNEVVHHINEIKTDDRLENFILFKHFSYHLWFHKKDGNYSNGIVFDGRNYQLGILPSQIISNSFANKKLAGKTISGFLPPNASG